MKVGTKSLLFGVHQFVLHPLTVLLAWLVYYKSIPRFYQLCAIVTHDWGYWDSPNMDGREGSNHPLRAGIMWLHFGRFGERVANEIIGHSGSYASRVGITKSQLFKADKLSVIFMPCYLYVFLGSLSGEILEYMEISDGERKDLYYTDKRFSKARTRVKIQWFFETTHLILKKVYDE